MYTKIKLSKVLLFLLVILPIYQDSPFTKYLGAAGYYILMPLSLILFFLYLVVRRHSLNNSFINTFFKLAEILVVVTLVSFVVWFILGNSFEILGENAIIKAIKVILQYISYPAYSALLLVCVRKNSIKDIERYSYVALILIFAICLIEKTQIPYAFQMLHTSGEFPYYRIRLLTPESSSTAMLIYVFSSLSIYYGVSEKRKTILLSSIFMIVVLLFNTGSKTLILSLFLTFFMYVFFMSKKLSRKKVLLIVFAMAATLVFGFKLAPMLIESFRNDINDYTSVATRFYTCLVGAIIGIIYPIGVGTGVCLKIFQSTLSKYMYIFEKLAISLNTSEIQWLINSKTDSAVTVKSGVLHFNMYWGIIGTIILMRNFLILTRRLMHFSIYGKEILLSMLWAGILMIVFALNFSFEFFLLFVFAVALEEKYRSEVIA